MEASFITETQNRRVSKKVVIIAALAVVAVIGTMSAYSSGSESTDFLLENLFDKINNLPVVKKLIPQDFLDKNKDFAFFLHKNKFLNMGVDEATKRLPIFNRNLDFINRTNSNRRSFKLEANNLTHLTPEEFASGFLGLKPNGDANQDNNNGVATLTAAPKVLPATLDWRGTNRVGAVKNQGGCGSCWAFTSIAILEGYYASQSGSSVVLSEQQLVDCANNNNSYYAFGCNGGWPPSTLGYAINVGIAAGNAYPYTGTAGSCNTTAKSVMKAKSVVNVNANVADYKAALQSGPIAMYVQADTGVFQFYKSGVLNDASCLTGGPNHAVTLVGYTADAWIVRNSWGSGWGDQGYIQIAQDPTANGGKGICGVYSWGSVTVN